MRDQPFDDMMAETFRKDPAHAVALLNTIVEDGEPEELLIVLRQIAKAGLRITIQPIEAKAATPPRQRVRAREAARAVA